MRKPILFICLLIPSIISGYDSLWMKTYGGSHIESFFSCQQLLEDGYIFAGYTGSYGAGLMDWYIVKTDNFGNPLWSKYYGWEEWDEASCVHATDDGGFVVAGFTSGSIYINMKAWIIKFNSSGDSIWSHIYDTQGDDLAKSVIKTVDSGYVFTGASSYDVLLIKLTSSGDTLWTRTFGDSGGSNYEIGHSVKQTNDNGYIITGEKDGYGFLLKTNNSGDLEWQTELGSTGLDVGNSVEQTYDDGYIIAGTGFIPTSNSYDIIIIKTDSLGDTIWTKTFGGSGGDHGTCVLQTIEGNYIVAGYTSTYGAGHADFLLIKLDEEGNLIWFETYGGINEDHAYSAVQTDDGCYLIAGATTSYGNGWFDAMVIKLKQDHDVAAIGFVFLPDTVLFPSMQNIIGVVRNYGCFNENFNVCCIVKDSANNILLDTILNAYTEIGGKDTLFFGEISMQFGESYSLSMITNLYNDVNTSNDSSFKHVICVDSSIHDIACTDLISPQDTVYPSNHNIICEMVNHGFITENFLTHCMIEDFFENIIYDTLIDIEMAPGSCDSIFLGSIIMEYGQFYLFTIAALLGNDQNPGNDSLIRTIICIDTTTHDIASIRFISPPEEVLVPSYQEIIGLIRNLGCFTEIFNVRCIVTDSLDQIFLDTIVLDTLNGLSLDTIVFGTVFLQSGHNYILAMITNLVGDNNPNNDTITSTTQVMFYWDFETGLQDWFHTSSMSFPSAWGVMESTLHPPYIPANPGDSSLWIDSENSPSLIVCDTAVSPIFYGVPGNWLKWSIGYKHIYEDTFRIIYRYASDSSWSQWIDIVQYTEDKLQYMDSFFFGGLQYDSIQIAYVYYGYNAGYASIDNIGPIYLEPINCVEEISLQIPDVFFARYISSYITSKIIIFELKLPETSDVFLGIYDITGRMVGNPYDGILSKGIHQITFYPEKSGIYFFKLEAGGFNQTGKFTVLR